MWNCLSNRRIYDDLCQSVHLLFYGHRFKTTTQAIKVRVRIIFSPIKVLLSYNERGDAQSKLIAGLWPKLKRLT